MAQLAVFAATTIDAFICTPHRLPFARSQDILRYEQLHQEPQGVQEQVRLPRLGAFPIVIARPSAAPRPCCTPLFGCVSFSKHFKFLSCHVFCRPAERRSDLVSVVDVASFPFLGVSPTTTQHLVELNYPTLVPLLYYKSRARAKRTGEKRTGPHASCPRRPSPRH